MLEGGWEELKLEEWARGRALLLLLLMRGLDGSSPGKPVSDSELVAILLSLVIIVVVAAMP
jgi:hypothetical protein